MYDRWGNELKLNPYYLIDRCIIAFGTYDPSLHAIIQQRVRPGAICFDVGANIGSVTVHLANCAGPAGRVHAFEPCPPVLARLRENVQRNHMESRIAIHEIALGDHVGTATMRFACPEAANQGMASIVGDDRGPLSQRSEVTLSTLDEFMDRQQVARVDFIKVDIQGAECAFLEGGRRTLSAQGPDLLIEVDPSQLHEAGAETGSLLKELEALGYNIYEASRGRPGAAIHWQSVPAGYSADNVLCTREVLPSA